jgi:hypothetical protein
MAITVTTPLAIPTTVVATPGAGGSLTASITYYYVVVAIGGGSDYPAKEFQVTSNPCAEGTWVTTDVNKQVVITWDAVTGANKYVVWFSKTTAGYKTNTNAWTYRASTNSATITAHGDANQGDSWSDFGYGRVSIDSGTETPATVFAAVATAGYTYGTEAGCLYWPSISTGNTLQRNQGDYFLRGTFKVVAGATFNIGAGIYFYVESPSTLTIQNLGIINSGSASGETGYNGGTLECRKSGGGSNEYGFDNGADGVAGIINCYGSEITADAAGGQSYRAWPTSIDLVLNSLWKQFTSSSAFRFAGKSYFKNSVIVGSLSFGFTSTGTGFACDNLTISAYGKTEAIRLFNDNKNVILRNLTIIGNPTKLFYLQSYNDAGWIYLVNFGNTLASTSFATAGTAKKYVYDDKELYFKVVDSGANAISGVTMSWTDNAVHSLTSNATGNFWEDSGTAESATASTLTDTDKSWTTDQWLGYIIRITGGTGIDQERSVLSNTGTILTLNANWITNPSSDSTYVIIPKARNQVWDNGVVAQGMTVYPPYNITFSKVGYKSVVYPIIKDFQKVGSYDQLNQPNIMLVTGDTVINNSTIYDSTFY